MVILVLELDHGVERLV